MITVGLGNESVWANKINYKYTKKQKNKIKKKANFVSQPLRSSCRPPLLLFTYLNNILILLHL